MLEFFYALRFLSQNQTCVVAVFNMADFVVFDFNALSDIHGSLKWLSNWMNPGLAPYDNDVWIVGAFEVVVALRVIYVGGYFHE